MSYLKHEKTFGYIYFMTEIDLFGYPSGSYVKIGLVKGTEEGRSSIERRKEHQTGNPRKIIIEKEIKTYAQVSTLESLIHQKLAKNRIHGEWFKYDQKGIAPYIEITEELKNYLESQIDAENEIANYLSIEDNQQEIKASSESKDIHKQLLKIKERILNLKKERELTVLKLKSFNKSFSKDIDGICSYEKVKPSQSFDRVAFQKDYPEIVDKIGIMVINHNFLIKKDLKQKKSDEIKDLEKIIKLQKFEEENSKRTIERNKSSIELHKIWLDIHVALQPLEIKRKYLENKLKLLTGDNLGIKEVCTWKRRKIKQVKKSDLINFDSELANKYMKIGKPTIKFKVNDYRPYTF